MPKPYDNALKRLMALCPQDFLNWLISGALSTGQRSQEFESVTIEADAMHETLFCERPMLFHVEFQSGPDPDMEQRLLEYSVLSWRRYKCTASTFVIYLRKGGEIANSPLIRARPDGKEVIRFDFNVILLWNIDYEDVLELGEGLLPLATLARNGARREVVEKIIARLTPGYNTIRRELLTLTRLLASLAFKRKEDQEWLRRRFAMLNDILRETPAYQSILQEGIEEGLEQGIERGRELARQEHLNSLRQMVLQVVQVRFPKLKKLAKGPIESVKDPELLEDLLIKVAMAKTPEKVLKYLQELDDDDEEEIPQRSSAPQSE